MPAHRVRALSQLPRRILHSHALLHREAVTLRVAVAQLEGEWVPEHEVTCRPISVSV